LVFLDVLMPGLSGPQVLQELGSNKTGKVILMSAYSGEHNIETAQQMGADLFIPKPFEHIFEVVAKAEALLVHA
jgi:DNA-binding response OmpR family regulator